MTRDDAADSQEAENCFFRVKKNAFIPDKSLAFGLTIF
jgi:hypothetical protein